MSPIKPQKKKIAKFSQKEIEEIVSPILKNNGIVSFESANSLISLLFTTVFSLIFTHKKALNIPKIGTFYLMDVSRDPKKETNIIKYIPSQVITLYFSKDKNENEEVSSPEKNFEKILALQDVKISSNIDILTVSSSNAELL